MRRHEAEYLQHFWTGHRFARRLDSGLGFARQAEPPLSLSAPSVGRIPAASQRLPTSANVKLHGFEREGRAARECLWNVGGQGEGERRPSILCVGDTGRARLSCPSVQGRKIAEAFWSLVALGFSAHSFALCHSGLAHTRACSVGMTYACSLLRQAATCVCDGSKRKLITTPVMYSWTCIHQRSNAVSELRVDVRQNSTANRANTSEIQIRTHWSEVGERRAPVTPQGIRRCQNGAPRTFARHRPTALVRTIACCVCVRVKVGPRLQGRGDGKVFWWEREETFDESERPERQSRYMIACCCCVLRPHLLRRMPCFTLVEGHLSCESAAVRK